MIPFPVPNTKLSARKMQAQAGRIPHPPTLQAKHMNETPSVLTTKPVLISEKIVPATNITDPSYPGQSRIRQIKDSPYYKITHEQYYDATGKRGFYVSHTGSVAKKFTKSVYRGASSETIETAGTTLRATATMERNASVEIDFLTVEAKNQLQLEATYEQSKTSTTSNVKRNSYTYEWTWPAGTQIALVLYQLIDRYTITRYDGTVVGHPMEVVNDAAGLEKSYNSGGFKLPEPK